MTTGMYTISFQDQSVSTAQDLLSVLPPSNRPVHICRVRIMQTGTADMVAGQEEALAVELRRGHTTAPSGGSVVTPTAADINQPSSGATTRRNDTTLATSGSALVFVDYSFNAQVGLDDIIPPDYRLRGQNANWINLRLRTAPADAITLSGTLWFEMI